MSGVPVTVFVDDSGMAWAECQFCGKELKTHGHDEPISTFRANLIAHYMDRNKKEYEYHPQFMEKRAGCMLCENGVELSESHKH